jgi:cytochrome c oxidase subunit 3
MPGAIAEELEIRHAGRGPGGGLPGGGDDGRSGGGTPRVPRRAYFTAISLGLAAIVMFFMALTSSYIVRKGLGGDWQAIRFPRTLWFNTAVLLISSATIEVARRKLSRGSQSAFRAWWAFTTLLGLTFLAGQLIAWRQLSAAGVFLSSNPSSSFFYVLSAAHGLHLAGGVLALLYVAFRTWTVAAGARISQDTAAELASIYWHFMDGLWVFLFLLLNLGR